MPADLFTDPHSLPIVALRPDAPQDFVACFNTILPGSVAVAVPWHDDPDQVVVYYEGGLYSREAGVPPTPQERVEYAKIAAGRAREGVPTVARFFLPNADALVRVGSVNIQTWEVQFDT